MNIKINDKEILELTETQKKVICNDIMSEELEADLKRRVQYALMHKYEQCFKRLKTEWEPKLKRAGVRSIPLDDEEFAELVFSQEGYKNRSQREAKEG